MHYMQKNDNDKLCVNNKQAHYITKDALRCVEI